MAENFTRQPKDMYFQSPFISWDSLSRFSQCNWPENTVICGTEEDKDSTTLHILGFGYFVDEDGETVPLKVGKWNGMSGYGLYFDRASFTTGCVKVSGSDIKMLVSSSRERLRWEPYTANMDLGSAVRLPGKPNSEPVYVARALVENTTTRGLIPGGFVPSLGFMFVELHGNHFSTKIDVLFVS